MDGDVEEHPGPSFWQKTQAAAYGTSLPLAQTSHWVPDLTQHGDVEPNPGPPKQLTPVAQEISCASTGEVFMRDQASNVPAQEISCASTGEVFMRDQASNAYIQLAPRDRVLRGQGNPVLELLISAVGSSKSS